MDWESKVKGIISAFYPGEQAGPAIAGILFGDVNPSGKLPLTFPKNENDTHLTTPEQFPGVNKTVNYSERLLIGYRWHLEKKIDPLYPFGHGLSYTTFEYSNLNAKVQTKNKINVTFNLKNSGKVFGKEVVQLYLGFPEDAKEPPRILKGFKKVSLKSQQIESIQMDLFTDSFSIWDEKLHNWRQIVGEFDLYIGSSSYDIRLHSKVTVPQLYN